MTREEAAEYFARKRDTLIWGLKDNRDETRQAHDAYNEAIDALCGPRPDPITGLVPCGCGGKATRSYSSIGCVVFCASCGLSTKNTFFASEAVNAWNVAMGYGAESGHTDHFE